MEEWKEYKLGDVIDKIIDNRGKSAPISEEKFQPIIEINSLGERKPNYGMVRKWVSKETYNTWFRSGHPIVGDILVPTVGTIGIVSLMCENKGCIAQNIVALRVNRKAYNLYIYYYLKSSNVKQQLLNLNIGGVQPSIKVPHLLNLDISLPTFVTQQKIANILSSLDDKIEVNRRINEQLEELAGALFKSWFVDFEPFKDGEFVDSELGMIPKGWKVGTLSDIGEVVGGATPSKSKSEYYTDNGISWITPKDLSINKDKFISKGEIDITELGYSKCSAKMMPRGSVLFSSRAPIGYIAIAKNELCTNQGFKSVVPQLAGTAFIYYYLKNNVSNIESMASGSTFKEASGALMKSLNVIVPPSNILQDFEEKVCSIFDKQESLEEEIHHLITLRDTLLPKLMSGEIDVNEVEI